MLKVCGINDADNLSALLELKIDFVGFIFHPPSPRNCDLSHTRIDEVFKNSQSAAKRVGVFVNQSEAFILDKVKTYNLDIVQLHGSESPEFCHHLKQQQLEIWKAISVKSSIDQKKLLSYQENIDALLFDTFGKLPGGNGYTFDWSLIDLEDMDIPFILSGGISLDHANSIAELKNENVFAIDINSRFELQAGVKNTEQISHFISIIKKETDEND